MEKLRIAWNQSLAIGNEKIDHQHQYLIELISAIPESASQVDSKVLGEALTYAGTHLADEEVLMEEIGYPGLPEHRQSHKKLVHTLLSYKKQYEEGDTDLYSFKQFMFRWVRDHIVDEDQKIGEFIRQQAQN